MDLKKTSIIKTISRIKKKILHILEFIFYKNPDPGFNEKTVYINIKDIKQFARYFYLLVKFFHIEGYRIVLPRKYSQFSQVIKENLFIKLLLKERIVNFKKRARFQYTLELNDSNLSPDYFAFLISKTMDNKETYHIPMTLFPLMYHDGIWNKPLKEVERKKSIFMIGNFDKHQYNEIKKTAFGILSRIDLYEFLEQKQALTFFNSLNMLEKFIEGNDDHACILIKSSDFNISMENIRPMMNRFSFFLACPGIVMPHSHNLVEAMSVGTIPIIQKKYAEMLHPPLENAINSIQFNDQDDLLDSIKWAYTFSSDQIKEMSKQVSSYYENYMTPGAVVKQIEKNSRGKIYLLAEHRSVEIYNRNLLKNR